MKALILAAGLGSRLKDITKDIPKCLVEVNGRSFLEYQLEALRKNNIKDIVIVIGYKGEKVKRFLEHSRFSDLNIKLVENREYDSSNSSYSFWIAKDEVRSEPYIHINCDILFSPELIKRIIKDKHENIIVIDKKADLNRVTEHAVLDENNRIINMPKSGLANEAHGKGCGIAKFSPDTVKEITRRAYQMISQGNKNEHFYGIIRNMLDKYYFYGIDSGDLLIKEVNTVNDLEELKELISILWTK